MPNPRDIIIPPHQTSSVKLIGQIWRENGWETVVDPSLLTRSVTYVVDELAKISAGDCSTRIIKETTTTMIVWEVVWPVI